MVLNINHDAPKMSENFRQESRHACLSPSQRVSVFLCSFKMLLVKGTQIYITFELIKKVKPSSAVALQLLR